jgi:hypothetical protein
MQTPVLILFTAFFAASWLALMARAFREPDPVKGAHLARRSVDDLALAIALVLTAGFVLLGISALTLE